jgi:GT2 family glycosyltransferase
VHVSFIIPLYNGLALTRAMEASLRATLPADLTHEVIWVDDGSSDGSDTWAASLPAPNRAMRNAHNLGFAGACNRGAATASGDALFFLNSDLVLQPAWLQPMLALVRARADAALVGNIQRSVRSGEIDHAGILFDAKGKPAHDRTASLLARVRGWSEVPAVTGACFAIRREVWQELGGFDEGFRNGGEDIDLALRARARGRRNYVSLRSVVGHHVSASPGRKLRDEENSRRLADRWREEIIALCAPAWSWAYLAHLPPREQRPPFLAFEVAAIALGIRRRCSARLRKEIDATLQREFTRWSELLDGIVPATTGESSPQRLDY